MANDIVVLGRIDAEAFEYSYPWACISIASNPEDFPDISRDNRTGLLQLVFADIVHPTDGFILFHDDQAHDILDFVTHNWESIDTLMVHCHAGISRSAAVAAAIARLKWGEEGEFINEPYEPNAKVYRTIREVATGRADYQPDLDVL